MQSVPIKYAMHRCTTYADSGSRSCEFCNAAKRR